MLSVFAPNLLPLTELKDFPLRNPEITETHHCRRGNIFRALRRVC